MCFHLHIDILIKRDLSAYLVKGLHLYLLHENLQIRIYFVEVLVHMCFVSRQFYCVSVQQVVSESPPSTSMPVHSKKFSLFLSATCFPAFKYLFFFLLLCLRAFYFSVWNYFTCILSVRKSTATQHQTDGLWLFNDAGTCRINCLSFVRKKIL